MKNILKCKMSAGVFFACLFSMAHRVFILPILDLSPYKPY